MSGNELAIVKKDVVDVVSNKVQEFVEGGHLHLPANYSAENAMKSAWLILQSTEDKDHNPVLAVCTRDSIANSLLDMVVQGLNPAKKQCYFIAYGKRLQCQRSYFGTMAVTKLVDESIDDIFSEVVYEGDTFKFRINRGRKEITEHESSLDNIDPSKIRAAYCMVLSRDGHIKRTEIMTIDEIKQAWRQSKMHPVDDKGNIKPGSTHAKFTADMCKKTVTNRCCKPIINSSCDNHLLLKSVNRADEERVEHEVAAEVDENANGEVIDVKEYTVAEDGPSEQPEEPAKEEAPASEGPGF